MENLFAVNMTDEEHPVMPIDAYVCRRTTETLEQKMDAHADEMTEQVEQATRSWPHYIGMGVTAIGAFVCFGFFDALTEEVETIPASAWAWLVAAAVALGGFFLILRAYHKTVSARLETDEMTVAAEQAEAYYQLSRQELGVPENVARIDVLCYSYTMKKGKEKAIRMANEHYMATEFDVFVEEGNLMVADATVLYALPLSAVTGVRKIEGGTRVYCWNKDEQPKEDPYKPYRIHYNDEDDVFTVRAIYAVEWADADKELLVPDYEWERVLQPLTGLSVTSTDKTVRFSIG